MLLAPEVLAAVSWTTGEATYVTPTGSSAYLSSFRIEWRVIFLGFWLLRDRDVTLSLLPEFLGLRSHVLECLGDISSEEVIISDDGEHQLTCERHID